MNVNGLFGSWLRQRRKALDLTQVELAEQVGCSVITIQKIEANERRPSKQIAERLADVLAISLNERAAFVAFARRLTNPPSELALKLTSLTPVHHLPPQTTPFIGRDSEIADIAQLLANPACKLLTLAGPGGSGKTRLALQVAAQQPDKFRDGVHFIPLAPLNSVDHIVPAIAKALGVK